MVFVTFVSLLDEAHHLVPAFLSELLTSSMIGSSFEVFLLGALLA